jgi:hypothetical protein
MNSAAYLEMLIAVIIVCGFGIGFSWPRRDKRTLVKYRRANAFKPGCFQMTDWKDAP